MVLSSCFLWIRKSVVSKYLWWAGGCWHNRHVRFENEKKSLSHSTNLPEHEDAKTCKNCRHNSNFSWESIWNYSHCGGRHAPGMYMTPLNRLGSVPFSSRSSESRIDSIFEVLQISNLFGFRCFGCCFRCCFRCPECLCCFPLLGLLDFLCSLPCPLASIFTSNIWNIGLEWKQCLAERKRNYR